MSINKVIVGDKEFSTRAAAAKFYGRNPRLVNRRVVELNWSIEQALELVPRTNIYAKHAVSVEGINFSSRSEAAKFYGLEPKLVNERVTKNKWTIEQALGIADPPNGKHSKTVVLEGIEHQSLRAVARKYGITQSTLMNRIKSGLSVEESILGANDSTKG